LTNESREEIEESETIKKEIEAAGGKVIIK
jgi:hypothetical protein